MIFILILSLLIFGCAKKPKTDFPTYAQTAIEKHVPPEEAQEDQLLDFDIERPFPKDPIHFDLNSDAIVSPYFVDRIGAWIKENRLKVVLTGHACPIGEDDYNYNLAERRALAVKTYLVTKFDFPGELIRIDSKGESNPVTTDESLYPLNRRVEVALESRP